MHLLVTGASGLLGLNLSLKAVEQGHTVTGMVHSRWMEKVPFDLQQIDLLNSSEAITAIERSQPDAIIHCAALADLNAAEKSPDLAYQINSNVPGTLAEAANRWGVPFVHISTDAVFDGQKGSYVETDPTHPLSVYAQSKLAGETAVQEAYPDALIARVVFYGWSLSGQRSLSEFFFNHLQAGQPVKGFTDTLFCPLYVEDLAGILLEMLSKGLTGLFHVVSPEHLSKYDFGKRLASQFGLDASLIEPVRMADLKRDALRSLNLTLNPGKAQSALGWELPRVDAGLTAFHQRWLEGYPAQLQCYLPEP